MSAAAFWQLIFDHRLFAFQMEHGFLFLEWLSECLALPWLPGRPLAIYHQFLMPNFHWLIRSFCLDDFSHPHRPGVHFPFAHIDRFRIKRNHLVVFRCGSRRLVCLFTPAITSRWR